MTEHNSLNHIDEPAVDADTFRVFLPGQRVYIQALSGAAPLLAMGELVTTIPAEGKLQLRWLAASALNGGVPLPGQRVRLSTGEKRILYVVEGVVASVIPDVMTSALISIEPACKGYNRRRHPRYDLRAYVKLGPGEGNYTFAPSQPVSVDLSIGGFGLRMPETGWAVDTRVHYELDVVVGETGSGINAVPAIRLQGEAEVRRRMEQPNNVVLFGFEFVEMSGYRAGVLQFWLDTFNVYMRES
jgi:hypothetical protein